MSTPTLYRKVTPAAIQLLPADAPREHWLAERRKGIGSSDVPAILGVTDGRKGRTAMHVWHDKRGTAPADDAGEAAMWGNLIEATVAQEWCRRNRSVIRRVGLVANETHPWQLATLDRRVAECPLDRAVKGVCGLEIKCRSAFKAARWHKTIPDDLLSQLIWQMIVTGYRHMHWAVLIGGNEYKQGTLHWDDKLATFVLTEVTTFWHTNILGGTRPAWDLDHDEALTDLDTRLHPVRVGETDLDGIGELMEYVEASAAAGVQSRRRDRARAALLDKADGAQYVTFENELAYEFAEITTSRCDLTALAERYPDAYAATVAEKTSYQLRIAKQYRGANRESA